MAEPPQGGNLLTRKYGPVPGWAYLAGAAGAAYLIIRHRSAADTSSAAAADGTGDTGDGTSNLDTSGQDGEGFGATQPYDMSGQVYTDLAGAQAQLQSESQRLDHVKAHLKQEKATTKRLQTRLGNVAPKTRVITVHQGDDSWKQLAAKYNTSIGLLERLNPHVRGKPGVGEKIQVPEQMQAHR